MDSYGRPGWDEYYLAQAWLIASRSIDPRTKHGCVLVSKDNRPLSQGFNGPLRGVPNEEVPLLPPSKYFHLLHSEENSLLSYNGSYQDIVGGTAYITGVPCHNCLRMMIQKGLKKIVCSQMPSVMIQDNLQEQTKATELMIRLSGVEVVHFPFPERIREVLVNTLAYFDKKQNV